MSKLSRAITAKQTGVKFPADYDSSIYVDEGFEPLDKTRAEYVVQVSVGAKTLVPAQDPHGARQAMSQARSAIIEEVFGEFRLSLYKLRNDIYSGYRDRAIERIDALIKQMYED